ncbi:unnamed protein product, partial [Bemisia tabaci]
RVPHVAGPEQDLPGVVPADYGRGGHRAVPLRDELPAHLAADPGHVLPLHAPADHPRRRLLHAQSPLLRPHRHHPTLRRRRHHLQHSHHRCLAVGGRAAGLVRAGDAAPGDVPVLGPHLCRRPRGRSRRLRGDPRQRDPLHRRLRRIPPQRCRHCRAVPHVRRVHGDGPEQADGSGPAGRVASFFVVAIGGTVIGIVWGFMTGFVTRFTNEVRVIEPIFIFVMAYMAYLNAEMFHMSGILAITFCGITMKNYVEANISHKSHTTVKYAMKMLSSSSETVIFMFLGVATVSDSHHWNTPFVLLTITFCSLYRALGVVLLTSFVNHFRLYKLNRVDKFVMSYGGLRGAVAFALVLLIDPKRVKLQPIFVTTTIAVIYFTVFIQGITIKPLVKVLNVKRAKKRKPTMNERIHERIMDHMMTGIEDILGRHGDHHVRDRFKRFDNQFIRPYLLRNHQGAEPKILETYSKLAMKDAMDYMRKIPSTIGNISGTESMSAIFRNYTSGNLNSSSSYPQLDASTWNIDLQELEYNPSKKDLTDAKIHHLLSEELVQPHRRHRRLSYSRHTVDDRDLSSQPVNYRMHMNIRRVMGDQRKHHHKRSKRLKDGKQNHVSFPGIQQNGSAKQFTHDYIDEVLQETEDNEENAKEDWENGITFTAKPSHELPFELNNAAKKLVREYTMNGPSGGDSSRVTTPTALEKMLPWKRGDNVGEVDTGPIKQNEFPAWCSNKEYLAYSSPSATFLGLFRRESSVTNESEGSLNQVEGMAPNSPSSVLFIEDNGSSGAMLISPNKSRRILTPRRGSMLELSPDAIPEEELLTVSGCGSTASLSERWSLRPVSRASSKVRQLSLPSTLNTSSFDTSSDSDSDSPEAPTDPHAPHAPDPRRTPPNLEE